MNSQTPLPRASGGGFRLVQRSAQSTLVWASRVVGLLALVAGAVTCGVTLLIVANRELLDSRITGLEEIALYGQGWFVALGAAYATAAATHFNLVFVLRRITGRRHAIISEYVADLTGLAVGGLLLVAGIQWWPFAVERRSEVLDISLAWAHSSVPVAGALIILFASMRLLAGPSFLAAVPIRLSPPEAEEAEDDDGAAAVRIDAP